MSGTEFYEDREELNKLQICPKTFKSLILLLRTPVHAPIVRIVPG
jgi:hypothetical protein